MKPGFLWPYLPCPRRTGLATSFEGMESSECVMSLARCWCGKEVLFQAPVQHCLCRKEVLSLSLEAGSGMSQGAGIGGWRLKSGLCHVLVISFGASFLIHHR